MGEWSWRNELWEPEAETNLIVIHRRDVIPERIANSRESRRRFEIQPVSRYSNKIRKYKETIKKKCRFIHVSSIINNFIHITLSRSKSVTLLISLNFYLSFLQIRITKLLRSRVTWLIAFKEFEAISKTSKSKKLNIKIKVFKTTNS